tara:strand:- start:1862 stop:2008 length:147 start_codon:yes stop_codon:yes gene_type:complete
MIQIFMMVKTLQIFLNLIEISPDRFVWMSLRVMYGIYKVVDSKRDQKF